MGSHPHHRGDKFTPAKAGAVFLRNGIPVNTTLFIVLECFILSAPFSDPPPPRFASPNEAAGAGLYLCFLTLPILIRGISNNLHPAMPRRFLLVIVHGSFIQFHPILSAKGGLSAVFRPITFTCESCRFSIAN